MSTKESIEFVGKFIGADEIESIVVCEEKTPQGNNIVEFKLKGGKTRRFPEKVAPYVMSDKRSDDSAVQQNRLTPVVRECVSAIMEYDLDYGDVEALVKGIHSNVMFQFDRANISLWGRPDSDFVPGMDPMYGVSLLDAYKILENIPKDEGGTDTTGGDTAAETAGN